MELSGFLAQLALVLSPITHGGNGGCGGPESPCQTGRRDVDIGRPFTVVVEGNVGSGKSTLLDIFAGRADVAVVPEPVDRWQDVNGTDLLDKVLNDGSRWAGAFQLFSSLTRYSDAVRTSHHRGDARATETTPATRLMERSVYSERACFLETMRALGQISDPEYLIMAKWFELMTASDARGRIRPDLIVYIRCDLSTLWSHIRKRGRGEEAKMDPRFVERLQRCHEDWLVHGNATLAAPAPVLVLNGDLSKADFEDMVRRRQQEILGRSSRG